MRKKGVIVRKMKNVIKIAILDDVHVAVITNKKCKEVFFAENYFKNVDDFSDCWRIKGMAGRTENYAGETFFVIFLRDKSFGVVVHECVHMVHHIFDFKGIDSSSNNSEMMAYLTEYMVNQVCKILKREKREKREKKNKKPVDDKSRSK